MGAAPAAVDTSIAARVRAEVERTIQRNIKGLDYLFSGDPNLGLTPKDTIYKKGTLQLYHYRPLAQEVYRVPVLLVMSLVSKYYILDLVPGQSFIVFRGPRIAGSAWRTTYSISCPTAYRE
jgi:polyhydroxyalkanoate synthase